MRARSPRARRSTSTAATRRATCWCRPPRLRLPLRPRRERLRARRLAACRTRRRRGRAHRTVELEAALRDLAHHADPRVRAQAADALGPRPRPPIATAAVTALVRAADDPHPSVRYAALLSLGELARRRGRRRAGGAPRRRRAAGARGGGDRARRSSGEARQARARGRRSSARSPSEEPEVRFQAVASLAEIDAARAAPLVRRARSTTPIPRCARRRRPRSATPASGGTPIALAAPARRRRRRAPRGGAGAGPPRRSARACRSLVGGARHAAIARSTPPRRWPGWASADDAGRARRSSQRVSRFFGDPLVKVRAAEALAKAATRAAASTWKAPESRRDDVRGLAESVLSSWDADMRELTCRADARSMTATATSSPRTSSPTASTSARPSSSARAPPASTASSASARALARRGAQRGRHGRGARRHLGRGRHPPARRRARPRRRATTRSSGWRRPTRAWSPSARPGSTTTTTTRRAAEQEESLRTFIAIARRAKKPLVAAHPRRARRRARAS